MSEIAPVEAPVTAEEPTTPVVESTTAAPAVPEVPAGPTYDWADEATQTRAAEALTRLEKYGNHEDVERALQIHEALRTEEGITSLFAQAGRALGLTAEQLDALFAEPVAEVEEAPDPDRVLTYAEFEAEFEKRQAASAAAARTAKQEEAQVTVGRQTVTETLAALKITDEDEVDAVLRAGQKYLGDGDWDPEHIKAAIRRGQADVDALVKKRQAAYVGGKIGQAAQLPGSIGGAQAPGGASLPEPQTLEEAKARARNRFRSEP